MRPAAASKATTVSLTTFTPGTSGRSSTPAMKAVRSAPVPGRRAAAGRAPGERGRGRASAWLLSSLALTAGTVESRAAGLDDAADAAGARERAVAARAGLPGAVIDGEAVLEIAELARGLDVVAQGRPAGIDRLAQHATDRLGEALRPLALHGAGKPLGRQPGPEQAL